MSNEFDEESGLKSNRLLEDFCGTGDVELLRYFTQVCDVLQPGPLPEVITVWRSLWGQLSLLWISQQICDTTHVNPPGNLFSCPCGDRRDWFYPHSHRKTGWDWKLVFPNSNSNTSCFYVWLSKKCDPAKTDPKKSSYNEMKWNVGSPTSNELKWNEMLLILQHWMWNEN